MKWVETWLRNAMGQRRTTVSGLFVALPVLMASMAPLFDGDPATVASMTTIYAATLGLLFSLGMKDIRLLKD